MNKIGQDEQDSSSDSEEIQIHMEHEPEDLKRRPKELVGIDEVVMKAASEPPTLKSVFSLVTKLVIRKRA